MTRPRRRICTIAKKRKTPTGYESIRKECLKRDGRKCQICGSSSRLEVHHIIPYSKSIFLRSDRHNLITLCKTHHREVTKKERFYQQMLQNIANANEESFRRKDF